MKITLANKTNRKKIRQFYKCQRYSVRFMGLDNCYYIEKNNLIIASVIISKINKTNNQHFLHALAVDVNYQGQGIATLLLQHVQKNHQPLVCFAAQELSYLYLQSNMKEIQSNYLEAQLNDILFSRFIQYKRNKKFLKAFISTQHDVIHPVTT